MTPTPSSARSRRFTRNVAIGAVAITAGVALPAMALERGGDDAVEAGSATQAPEITSTTSTSTSTTLDPEVAEFYRQQAVNGSLAFMATLTPDQLFALESSAWTDADRAEFLAFAEQQQVDQFYAEQAFFEGVRQAEIARQEAERAEAARQQARQAAQRAATAAAPARSSGSVWDRLAQCEAGGNWSYPTVSGGFSGGLMFHSGTWNAMGGRAYAPNAYQATREQQIAVAEKVLASQGWGAWPACSRKLGLR